jgi:predicted ester cyclase
MSAEENKATIRRWVEEAWNTGNFASADGMYTATYVLHDSSGPIEGPTGLTQFIIMFRIAFPDLHMTIEDQITEGDKVAWRFTTRGTHTGEFMGIPPTGKQVTVTGMVCSRFAGSKWEEDWSNFDALGMLQQFGVIPGMG